MSSFHRSDWLSLASPIVTLMIVVGGYWVGYLQEKGKNRATAEDIGKLTRAVEDIKTENAARLAEISHQNAVLIEQLKSQNQLRAAAIDRRLQAHQEAYELWRKLIGAMHSDDYDKVVLECQTWWDQNCLYLEKEPRQEFYQAYMFAGSVRQRSLYGSGMSQDALNVAIENERKIYECGNVIVRAVELPALADGAEGKRATAESR
jgi:hypothetical protein